MLAATPVPGTSNAVTTAWCNSCEVLHGSELAAAPAALSPPMGLQQQQPDRSGLQAGMASHMLLRSPFGGIGDRELVVLLVCGQGLEEGSAVVEHTVFEVSC
jgi:hypothetical protein